MPRLELETMRCELDGHLARLRFNRPEALNAANWAWVQDLVSATDYLAQSAETRVVIVSGDLGRHGIAILFNFIVAFPDESTDSLKQTLNVAKALRALSPDFEVAVFYYKPYPGNDIAEMLLRQGYQFPRTLEDWAAFLRAARSSLETSADVIGLDRICDSS